MKKITFLEDMNRLWPMDEAVVNNKKAAVGTVIKQVTLADPHVRKLIAYVHKKTKASVKDIEAHIQEEVDKLGVKATRSPLLFGTMMHTAIESALFHMFKPVEHRKGDEKFERFDVDTGPKFDPVIFSRLLSRVKIENAHTFPLRNVFKKKPIAAPRVIYIPNKDAATMSKYGDITTAAATPNGEFIFNVPFMQQCMDYSHVRGIVPKGKKFKSNGGTFPDEYAMLEFLILHEFYHYTQGDFHYDKVVKGIDGGKADGQIINWVGDFRTNYDLVKAGFEPIPMGLYNELINYDRQETYQEMYHAVERELEKVKTVKVGDMIRDPKTDTHHVVTSVDEKTGKVTARKPTAAELSEYGVTK